MEKNGMRRKIFKENKSIRKKYTHSMVQINLLEFSFCTFKLASFVQNENNVLLVHKVINITNVSFPLKEQSSGNG